MAALSPSAILTAWETGAGRAPLDRGLGLLWAAGYSDDLADWPTVSRDAALLQLRGETFGQTVDLLARCPECGTQQELTVSVADLLADPPQPSETEAGGLRLRALTSRDLASVAGVAEDDLARALAERLSGQAVPADVLEEVAAHLEAREADRQITLALTCVECAAVWRETLDVAALLWAEVDAAALRIMDEVAEMARAFGWTEAETLALPAARRRRYLAMARAQ